MRQINKTVLHCSDSKCGNAKIIRSWHIGKEWQDIGYHFVINNCYPTHESIKNHKPCFERDGMVEKGRSIEMVGAHVKGENTDSVGICLIGKDQFTLSQIQSLYLILFANGWLDLPLLGHCELDIQKTCPNIDMTIVKDFIQLK